MQDRKLAGQAGGAGVCLRVCASRLTKDPVSTILLLVAGQGHGSSQGSMLHGSLACRCSILQDRVKEMGPILLLVAGQGHGSEVTSANGGGPGGLLRDARGLLSYVHTRSIAMSSRLQVSSGPSGLLREGAGLLSAMSILPVQVPVEAHVGAQDAAPAQRQHELCVVIGPSLIFQAEVLRPPQGVLQLDAPLY